MVLAGFWGFGVLALCLLAQSMNRDVFEQRHIVERLARAVDHGGERIVTPQDRELRLLAKDVVEVAQQ